MTVITESGVEQTLLTVKSFKDNESETPIITWDFGDRTNAYFLIGVLELIKQDLLDEINLQSQKNEDE